MAIPAIARRSSSLLLGGASRRAPSAPHRASRAARHEVPVPFSGRATSSGTCRIRALEHQHGHAELRSREVEASRSHPGRKTPWSFPDAHARGRVIERAADAQLTGLVRSRRWHLRHASRQPATLPAFTPRIAHPRTSTRRRHRPLYAAATTPVERVHVATYGTVPRSPTQHFVAAFHGRLAWRRRSDPRGARRMAAATLRRDSAEYPRTQRLNP